MRNPFSYQLWHSYRVNDEEIDIRIDLPLPDIQVKIGYVHYVGEKSGVYILYNALSIPLYVGQSGNLKNRINQHIEGKTNTKFFYGEIMYVSCYCITSVWKKEVLEWYLINTMKPMYNVERVETYTPEQHKRPEPTNIIYLGDEDDPNMFIIE